MKQWEKEFTTITTIVNAIYGAMIIHAGLVYFRIPAITYCWEQTQQIMFFALLAMSSVTFLISPVIGNQLMSSEKLAEKFRAAGGAEQGLSAVSALVRTGTIIMAVIGEACAVYGLLLYFLSGDGTRPWIFFALSAGHYPLTMAKLKKARADVERLSRSY